MDAGSTGSALTRSAAALGRDHHRIPAERPWPALERGAVHVWRFALDLRVEEVEPLRRVLDAAERARADRFVFPRDRSRFVVAHGTMRRLLGRYLRCDPAELRFRTGPHGKPALLADDPAAGSFGGELDLQFNLSHSDGIALLAVANGPQVGVDVEVHRPVPEADRIAASVFSPGELARWRDLPSSDRLSGFFDGWTRKEAFVKALGVGLSMAPDRVDVTLAVDESSRGAERWTVHGGGTGPGISSAIAVKWSTPPEMSFFTWEPS